MGRSSWIERTRARLQGPRYLRNAKVLSTLDAFELRRPYGRRDGLRALVLYEPNRIALSQVYPFFDWRWVAGTESIAMRVKAISLPKATARGLNRLPDAALVIYQTSAYLTPSQAGETARSIRDRFPDARIVLLDWVAHAALPWAGPVVDDVDLYVKKCALADRDRYGDETIGDTNLTDYSSRQFGLENERFQFAVPARFFEKFLVGPSFLTERGTVQQFARPFDEVVPDGPRPIDLHARLAVNGAEWYSRMRTQAIESASRLDGLVVERGSKIKMTEYHRELSESKLTYSPFGYGELCWRDFEGFLSGSVVVKPSMDHLEVAPRHFVPGVTYLPVRWDAADLEEVVRPAVSDPERLRSIARAGYEVIHNYIGGGGLGGFIRQVVGAAAKG